MPRYTDVQIELKRTVDLDSDMAADGAHVHVADGQNSWWQPVAALLPLLRPMPDWDDRVAAVRAGYEAEPAEPEEPEMLAYAAWCRETAPAGYFGHNNEPDTMPVPADFRE